MRKKNNKTKNKIPILIFLLIIILVLVLLFDQSSIEMSKKFLKTENMYLASDSNVLTVYELDEDKLINPKKMVRGTMVKTKQNTIEKENVEYTEIFLLNKVYYVVSNNLVTNKKDIVKEKSIFVRIPATILKNVDTSEILSLALKGENLEVVGYNKLDKDGNVDTYVIKKDGNVGYIYGKYVTYTKEEAGLNYNQDLYDNVYSKVNNQFGGGEAEKLAFSVEEKPKFANNVMPKSVYALYLNSSREVINNIDSYMEFARDTKINSFVVDIKDNEAPAYPAETFKKLSPTSYELAINAYDEYKEAIDKLKANGFYVIGRITTFKDSYYVKDNPNCAIIDKSTNSPYSHNGSNWPSAYSRDVWYYNVSLAKEAVMEFGFNEINFDYVRFPDRTQRIENKIDFINVYGEDKVEAIERFVRYATDELHKLNVYVSVDVFGETTNGTYTTPYGQYWPSISSIVDVISAMPYPDHFSDGYYGISKPWNNPYKLLNTWGSFAVERQKETTSPAIVRTWIQAYDVMKYVDSSGIQYNAKEVEQEIRALYDAGLTGGYVTWLSNSNLSKYKKQQDAFKIDYMEEYNDD